MKKISFSPATQRSFLGRFVLDPKALVVSRFLSSAYMLDSIEVYTHGPPWVVRLQRISYFIGRRTLYSKLRRPLLQTEWVVISMLPLRIPMLSSYRTALSLGFFSSKLLLGLSKKTSCGDGSREVSFTRTPPASLLSRTLVIFVFRMYTLCGWIDLVGGSLMERQEMIWMHYLGLKVYFTWVLSHRKFKYLDITCDPKKLKRTSMFIQWRSRRQAGLIR